ncbi:alpha/beta fold hydrolase [Massilia sp. S19_KUP03_FR1]|uniref:alpha/beta fold hydrolase n=1 Tax=Massilia sp. S19_KUP03_FR1 TaxID=3025503 RepID=UPI002FCD88A2
MTKPLLHFTHGNSYPAGTYRQLLAALAVDFDVRSVDMHGHNPAYPVTDNWRLLVDELIHRLESYGQPAILVGHSLGGMLSMMAARQRPELVRCVVMVDSPVVAGWRAWLLRLFKQGGWTDRFSPARFSARRRHIFPNRQAAYEHFNAKPIFAAWAPGVLDDYLDHGLQPHPEGVQLRFSRDVESEIYRTLPHTMGRALDGKYPVPIGFIGGRTSAELRQAGAAATRKLVGDRLVMVDGGHLFPLEAPQATAAEIRQMIARLLA